MMTVTLIEIAFARAMTVNQKGSNVSRVMTATLIEKLVMRE